MAAPFVRHVTVIAAGGSAELMSKMGPLCAHLKSTQLATARLHVHFRPSIASQISDGTVGNWTKAVTALYTTLGPSIDVTCGMLEHSQAECGSVVDLSVLPDEPGLPEPLVQPNVPASTKPDRVYQHTVVGGTFDRLHTGHKILLSAALLRSRKSITVGVSGPPLLERKILSELIEPLAVRIAGVQSFLSDVNKTLEQKVVEILDPFGPSIVDPRLECIVGSAETERGCLMVNQKRGESGLSQLDIHLVDIVEDEAREGDYEEQKISSSSGRTRLLGTRLRPPIRSWDRSTGPYIIGLTGGSASGKTSIGKRLVALGAVLVDCDKLGHEAYLPGTAAHSQIVQEFGPVVLAEDGTINRRELGGLVFADSSKLEKLNSIVWPEISKLAAGRTQKAWKEDGAQIAVWDAAVLLDAGWDRLCHEVWVCTLPRDEAIKRIVERDGKTRQEAERRLNSQMSNSERCQAAQTVFCTLWEGTVTQRQVERAWHRLVQELHLAPAQKESSTGLTK